MASEATRRRTRARYGFVAGVSLVLALIAASPAGSFLARLGGDLVLPAVASRARLPQPNVALIVIDEVTHRTAPFNETPEVAWTPYIAKVMDATGAAGAKVVGLDMVYSKTLASPDILPGFDRPFLTTLASLGRTGRLVLAETRLSDGVIAPYRGQVIAVGEENVRPVTFRQDRDGVVRAFPAMAQRENASSIRAFASELAARAGHATADAFLIDFRRPAADFPAYRLSDLNACLEQGRTEVFDAFRDKVVLVGVALDVEDRHLAANRFFADTGATVRSTPCAPAAKAGGASRLTAPGVIVQAYAVDTLMRGSAPHVMGAWQRLVAGLVLFIALAAGFLKLRPLFGAMATALFAAALWPVSVLALTRGVLIPWVAWAGGGLVLLAAIYGYRTFVEDAARRRVTHAFGHYLNPALVDQLAEDPDRLKLGGERRRVAVMFADLEGFTAYSELHAKEPETIVARLNALFARIVEIVDAHGGYVDKFLGDGVMAVWGAPGQHPEPEAAAARAALAIVEAVEEAHGDSPFQIRVGLSAGMVVAGNLGAPKRYDYTVIGEAVNRAARLEDAARTYDAYILADGELAAQLPSPEFRTRKVASTALRGTLQTIDIHHVLRPKEEAA